MTCPPHFQIAERLAELGIHCLPLATDGSRKTTTRCGWAQFQQEPPTAAHRRQWFSRPCGIAVICGRVSGNLEVLDCESHELFRVWHALAGVAEIVSRLPVVESPKGYHCYLRCESIGRSQPLARDSAGKVIFETRSQGGLVTTIGGHPGAHKSGRIYVQAMGPELLEIPVPTITTDERQRLLEAARAFDWTPPPPAPKPFYRRHTIASGTPWDWFADHVDWPEVLGPAGWVMAGIKGGERTWRRPGKDGDEISARECVERTGGRRLLRVFSTSAELRSGTHNTYSAMKHLRFAGDGRQAARYAKSLQEGR